MSWANFNVSNVGIKLERCMVWSIVRSPSSTHINSHIAASVVNGLLSVLGTVLNLLVVYIFLKSPKLRSRVPYFGIMVVSSVDLGVVTIVQPLFIILLLKDVQETSNCFYFITYTTVAFLFATMSTASLVTINIERYFSIVRPIFHRNTITKKRLLLIFGFVWFVGLSTYVPWFSTSNLAWIGTAVFIFLICGTSFSVYLSIFLVARKKLRSIHLPSDTRSVQVTLAKFMAFKRELMIAKMYVLIVLLSFCCYLPFGVVLVHEFVDRNNEWTDESRSGIIAWTLTLLYMNSTLNSLVFFWTNRKLRKEGVNIVRKSFKLQETVDKMD